MKRVFGNGLPLYLDGIASEASFNRPMGMSAAREFLYVADTGNHAVRRIRLMDGYIDSLLGNGKPGRTEDKAVGMFHEVQLNNPSSVSVRQDILVVADTGNNCLRMFNLANKTFSSLVGSGALGSARWRRSTRRDGASLGAFGQQELPVCRRRQFFIHTDRCGSGRARQYIDRAWPVSIR